MTRVVAFVGSYRRDGTTVAAVEAVLAGAREKGAVTQTIHLCDRHIEFCANCRQCVQTPDPARGRCVQQDGLEPVLMAIENADCVVLASPVNYYNVTAIYRRFMERLLGFSYWPWGQNTPALRTRLQPRKAVLIASAGMPGFLIPLATGAARALRLSSQMLGARPIAKLWVGLAAGEPHHLLSKRTRQRARRIGWKLA
jgi:multimeric flavodoxin WrbA